MLVNAPRQSVLFIHRHLRPIAPADPQKVNQLIADLASARFAVRNQATQELDKLAELAESALQKAVKREQPLEVRRRIEQLLAKLHGPITSPEQLRSLRSIEVLEHIGTTEARQLLQSLAKGAPYARVTQEAQAALQRLLKRSSEF
jgi:hypothetical protein